MGGQATTQRNARDASRLSNNMLYGGPDLATVQLLENMHSQWFNDPSLFWGPLLRVSPHDAAAQLAFMFNSITGQDP